MITCAHFFACLWNLVALGKDENQEGWFKTYELQDASYYSQYLNSFYFAIITMTTIGYGDYFPQNNNERLFCLTLSIFSCGVFGYIINSIGTIILNYQNQRENFEKKLAALNIYMSTRNVNSQIQQNVRKYLEYKYEIGLDFNFSPNKCLEEISSSLREEIFYDVYLKALNKIGFLKNNFSQKFLEKLSLKVDEKIYGSGEIINQYPNYLHFIQKGVVNLYHTTEHQRNKKKIKSLHENQHFGSLEFFSMGTQKELLALSDSITYIYQISLEHFEETIKQFSEDKEIFHQIKDTILLYNKFSMICYSCISCKQSSHNFLDCPYLSFSTQSANKQKVIKQQLIASKNENQPKFQRRLRSSDFSNSLNTLYDNFFYFCEFLFHNLLDDAIFVETYYNNSEFKDVLARYGEQLFGQLQNENLNYTQDQVIQEKRNIYLSLYEELKLGEEIQKQAEENYNNYNKQQNNNNNKFNYHNLLHQNTNQQSQSSQNNFFNGIQHRDSFNMKLTNNIYGTQYSYSNNIGTNAIGISPNNLRPPTIIQTQAQNKILRSSSNDQQNLVGGIRYSNQLNGMILEEQNLKSNSLTNFWAKDQNSQNIKQSQMSKKNTVDSQYQYSQNLISQGDIKGQSSINIIQPHESAYSKTSIQELIQQQVSINTKKSYPQKSQFINNNNQQHFSNKSLLNSKLTLDQMQSQHQSQLNNYSDINLSVQQALQPSSKIQTGFDDYFSNEQQLQDKYNQNNYIKTLSDNKQRSDQKGRNTFISMATPNIRRQRMHNQNHTRIGTQKFTAKSSLSRKNQRDFLYGNNGIQSSQLNLDNLNNDQYQSNLNFGQSIMDNFDNQMNYAKEFTKANTVISVYKHGQQSTFQNQKKKVENLFKLKKLFEEMEKLDSPNNGFVINDLKDTRVQSYVYYFPKNNVEEIVKLYNINRKKITNVLEKNFQTKQQPTMQMNQNFTSTQPKQAVQFLENVALSSNKITSNSSINQQHLFQLQQNQNSPTDNIVGETFGQQLQIAKRSLAKSQLKKPSLKIQKQQESQEKQEEIVQDNTNTSKQNRQNKYSNFYNKKSNYVYESDIDKINQNQ